MSFLRILYLASCSSFIYQSYNVTVNNILIIHVGTTGLAVVQYLYHVMFHCSKDGYTKGHFIGITVYDNGLDFQRISPLRIFYDPDMGTH